MANFNSKNAAYFKHNRYHARTQEILKNLLYFSGKIKKQRSYQHDSLTEAIMLSIDNLEPKLKERYQQLAVFLDDVGIPTKV